MRDHYALLVCQILQILAKIYRAFVALQNKDFLPRKTYLSQQWTLDGYVCVCSMTASSPTNTEVKAVWAQEKFWT